MARFSAPTGLLTSTKSCQPEIPIALFVRTFMVELLCRIERRPEKAGGLNDACSLLRPSRSVPSACLATVDCMRDSGDWNRIVE